MLVEKYHIIFVAIVFLQFIGDFIKGFSFQSKTIKLNSFSECPEEEETVIHFNGTITKLTRNKYTVNGEFTFNESVGAPIEVLCKN